MSLRDEVLTALRGGRPDRVPFTCYQGLLPAGAESIENLALVTSGTTYRTEGPETRTSTRQASEGVVERTMETPWGALTQVCHTETGYGSSWTREHWIKSPGDYAIIERLIRETRVIADDSGYRAACEKMGERGVVYASLPRPPFQRTWIQYTGIERLAFDLMDAPVAVERLLEAFMNDSLKVLETVAASNAELVWLPDNITGSVTGNRLFDRYLAPYYQAVCERLLPLGKLPCCHMDGMLSGIADETGATDLPVIEAFTPPPDGDLSVAEARERWPGKALWLNFPSSVHLSSPEEIERVTRELVQQAGDRKGFAIGITENIPAAVGSRSLEAIGRVLAET